MKAQIRKIFILVVNYYLMCSGLYRKIFERIMISLKGTVVNQMACTTEYCFTKTRLKKHLLQDLMGVSKIMFILKDPVVGRFNNILLTKTCVILSKSFPYSCHPPTIAQCHSYSFYRTSFSPKHCLGKYSCVPSLILTVTR